MTLAIRRRTLVAELVELVGDWQGVRVHATAGRHALGPRGRAIVDVSAARRSIDDDTDMLNFDVDVIVSTARGVERAHELADELADEIGDGLSTVWYPPDTWELVDDFIGEGHPPYVQLSATFRCHPAGDG